MHLWSFCAALLSLVTIAYSLKFNIGNLFGDQDDDGRDSDTILIGSSLPSPLRSAAEEQHLQSSRWFLDVLSIKRTWLLNNFIFYSSVQKIFVYGDFTMCGQANSVFLSRYKRPEVLHKGLVFLSSR